MSRFPPTGKKKIYVSILLTLLQKLKSLLLGSFYEINCFELPGSQYEVPGSQYETAAEDKNLASCAMKIEWLILEVVFL